MNTITKLIGNNLDSRQDIDEARERVNDELKRLRRLLKLPKKHTDLNRLRIALHRFKEGTIEYGEMYAYVSMLIHDKYLAGLRRQYYPNKHSRQADGQERPQ